MEKPDWVLWGDPYRSVTLEECVCLSLDADPHQKPKPLPPPVKAMEMQRKEGEALAAPVVPYFRDHLTSQQRNEMLERTHEALRTPKGQERLGKLRHHFDQGSRMLPPQGQPDYHGAYAEKRVKLLDFARWAYAMKWEVPEPLDITPTPAADNAQEPAMPAPMVTAKECEVPSVANWKMLVQTEATALCLRLRSAGANPTKNSILESMAKWCRDNDVKTDRKIYPSANYLRTHVLGGKHWDVPN